MGRVNPGRLLVGGLAAGVVFNLAGMTSASLLDLPATFARLGVEPGAGTAALHSSLRLGLGVAAVAAYAGIRGGLGPGPRTALWTALLVWFIGYVPGSAVLHELGALTDRQFGLGLVLGLVESAAALLVGAWLYREAPAPVSR